MVVEEKALEINEEDGEIEMLMPNLLKIKILQLIHRINGGLNGPRHLSSVQ